MDGAYHNLGLHPAEHRTQRLAIDVRGRVQGVGYRFFVRELAIDRGFTGWVRNEPDGSVHIEAQGAADRLKDFCAALEQGPMLSSVEEVRVHEVARVPAETQFVIRH